MQYDGRFRHLLFHDDKPSLKTADDDPPYVKERLAKWIDFYQHGYFRERTNEIWLVCWTIVISALISVVNVFSIRTENPGRDATSSQELTDVAAGMYDRLAFINDNASPDQAIKYQVTSENRCEQEKCNG